MLLDDLLTSQLQRDPASDLAFSQTCSPAQLYAVDHAKSFGQIAPAIPYRPSALWENNLQRLDNQLHPAVFLDGQQGDDFRACSNDDGDDCSSGGVHD